VLWGKCGERRTRPIATPFGIYIISWFLLNLSQSGFMGMQFDCLIILLSGGSAISLHSSTPGIGPDCGNIGYTIMTINVDTAD
jgi:hypothetical protein